MTAMSIQNPAAQLSQGKRTSTWCLTNRRRVHLLLCLIAVHMFGGGDCLAQVTASTRLLGGISVIDSAVRLERSDRSAVVHRSWSQILNPSRSSATRAINDALKEFVGTKTGNAPTAEAGAFVIVRLPSAVPS